MRNFQRHLNIPYSITICNTLGSNGSHLYQTTVQEPHVALQRLQTCHMSPSRLAAHDFVSDVVQVFKATTSAWIKKDGNSPNKAWSNWRDTLLTAA